MHGDHSCCADQTASQTLHLLLALQEANLAVAVVREQQRTDALFAAALEADRNAKLSIFATRPAIYSPLWNFYSEASGTVFLLLTSLLIELSVSARRLANSCDLICHWLLG